MASVAFPAWVMGRDPGKKVISISYSQDLTKKLSGDFRRLVERPLFKTLFHDFRLSEQKNTETEQSTSSGGFRYATSVGGTLTDGTDRSLTDIATANRVDPSEVSRILPLAFLSPKLIDAVLAGNHPVQLTAQRLSRVPDLPNSWTAQEALLAA